MRLPSFACCRPSRWWAEKGGENSRLFSWQFPRIRHQLRRGIHSPHSPDDGLVKRGWKVVDSDERWVCEEGWQWLMVIGSDERWVVEEGLTVVKGGWQWWKADELRGIDSGKRWQGEVYIKRSRDKSKKKSMKEKKEVYIIKCATPYIRTKRFRS